MYDVCTDYPVGHNESTTGMISSSLIPNEISHNQVTCFLNENSMGLRELQVSVRSGVRQHETVLRGTHSVLLRSMWLLMNVVFIVGGPSLIGSSELELFSSVIMRRSDDLTLSANSALMNLSLETVSYEGHNAEAAQMFSELRERALPSKKFTAKSPGNRKRTNDHTSYVQPSKVQGPCSNLPYPDPDNCNLEAMIGRFYCLYRKDSTNEYNKSWGNGALISENCVLTAAHIFCQDEREKPAFWAIFCTGEFGTESWRQVRIARVLFKKSFLERAYNNEPNDVAIVVLKEKFKQYFFPEVREKSDLHALKLISYRFGKWFKGCIDAIDTQVLQILEGEVVDQFNKPNDSTVVLYEAMSLEAMSGSPIWYKNEGGRYCCVGVHLGITKNERFGKPGGLSRISW